MEDALFQPPFIKLASNVVDVRPIWESLNRNQRAFEEYVERERTRIQAECEASLADRFVAHTY